jgi:hypothetical protein
MNTVITHFYNEEYLLPWWINHHKKLFDYGIMINHNSTDRSLEICKELCPSNWKIVDTTTNDFDAQAIDNEVKEHETTVEGFKIALTVGEFLLTSMSLNDVNDYMQKNNANYLKTHAVCMVDENLKDLPTHSKSLIEQKHHGMINNYTANDVNSGLTNDLYYILYSRYYHNMSSGCYSIGRHALHNNTGMITSDSIFTLKYKFCPWNENMTKRIEQFGKRINKRDAQENRGTHFLMDPEWYESEHCHLAKQAYNLTENVTFKAAFDYCNSL